MIIMLSFLKYFKSFSHFYHSQETNNNAFSSQNISQTFPPFLLFQRIQKKTYKSCAKYRNIKMKKENFTKTRV